MSTVNEFIKKKTVKMCNFKINFNIFLFKKDPIYLFSKFGVEYESRRSIISFFQLHPVFLVFHFEAELVYHVLLFVVF